MIRGLNPIPSRGFASAERPVYLVPEATVFCRDGEVIIEMERGSQPKVELNQYYCSLLGSGEDTPETRDYLRRMMAEANELISGLQSREKTLRQILGAIVKGQRDFFLKGAALAPLTMQQVAEELGLSTSTVSRAVKDKYLSFQGRSLALRSFFVAALPTGEGASPPRRRASTSAASSRRRTRPRPSRTRPCGRPWGTWASTPPAAPWPSTGARWESPAPPSESADKPESRRNHPPAPFCH